MIEILGDEGLQATRGERGEGGGEEDDISRGMSSDEQDRRSHHDFLNNLPDRDWSLCHRLWAWALSEQRVSSLPVWLYGEPPYTITSLQPLHDIGCGLSAGRPVSPPTPSRKKSSQDIGEFESSDPRYSRHNIALVIGYNGSQYTGYQQQRGVEGIRTVEDDLDVILDRKVTVAGRTDKGVSALSQVVSFKSKDPVDTAQLFLQLRLSEPCKDHRLAIYECKRVPRRFHAVFCATWRRYVYLFPLRSGHFCAPFFVDVDGSFVNSCLSKLVGKELPYNGFAHRDNRETGSGLSDLCTLYRAEAKIIDLSEQSIPSITCGKILCIELVGNRFLRRMVRILVATAVRESVRPLETRDEDVLYKIAVTRDRSCASLAVLGDGLALCGVGYDLNASILNQKQAPREIQTDRDNLELKGKRCNGASRRKRRKKDINPAVVSSGSKLDADLDNRNIAPFSVEDITGSYAIVPSLQWSPYAAELIAVDADLLYFPHRCFSFSLSGIELVVNQDCNAVGTTVWDAEVLLSHYIDSFVFPSHVKGSNKSAVLELGAGTAVAAILCAKSCLFDSIVIQDLPEVVPAIIASLDANGLTKNQESRTCSDKYETDEVNVQCISCPWGSDCVSMAASIIPHQPFFDLILLADVLYHTEHFDTLLFTVTSLLAGNGTVLLCFEQRRKDLSQFVGKLCAKFVHKQVYEYRIKPRVTSEVQLPDDSAQTTVFYLCLLSGFVREDIISTS